MNEMTRYNNQLNTVPMRKWSAEEQDFFFAIITEARDKGTQLLTFDKEQLKELANYSERYNKRFVDTMESLAKKMIYMNYYEKTKNSFEIMNLFQKFKINWSDDFSEMTAEIRVSEDFEYILNKLEANFTQFELKQFTNIRSTYAKEMFKKLKQWRTLGKKEFAVDEFREMLQVPQSYRATDINQVVLKPIKDELSLYFEQLKIKPIKARKRGNPVIAYEFTWKPEETGDWVENKFKPKTAGRKETLPDWVGKEFKETPMSEEEQAKYREELRKMREKK